MSKTLELETRLKKLGLQIQVATNRAEKLQDDAALVISEMNARGVSLTGHEATRHVANVQGQLDEAAAEIARAREAQGIVMEQMSRLVPGGESVLGSGGGGVRLNFGHEDLRAAHAALLRREPVSLGGGGIYAATDVGAVPQGAIPSYLPGDLWPYLRERPFLYEAFAAEQAESSVVTVYKGTGAASSAAFVAAGAPKPTSTPTWAAVSVTCQIAAHLAVVDNAVVQDYSAWQDLIGREMIAGLLATIDAGILSGNGVGANLHGILTDGSIGSVVRDTTNETRIDAIHRGLTTVRNAYFADPQYLVLHPNDLREAQTEKASTAGLYLAGNPNEAEIRTLWGLTIIPTTAITEGTGLIFNNTGARLFWRIAPGIEINPYESTAWSQNQISLRCEAKVGFSVVRPEAFCKLSLL